MHLYRDFLLSDILYYKIGGRAEFLLKIQNRDDLLEALDFVQKNKIRKVLPVGLGSNLLVSDNFFDGAVLWFLREEPLRIKLVGNSRIEAFASELLDNLVKFSFANNLVGLEWAGGLPSTVGGAIQGNAGAFGGEISNAVENVEIVKLLDEGYTIEKLAKDQLEFGYRKSLFKKHKNWIIGNCYFRLSSADKDVLEKAKETYLSHIDYRNKNHPVDFPSCGSVFKNITRKEDVNKVLNIWEDIRELSENKWYHKVSTGYVIKRLGFSGFQIGGAKVSEKHANYIVNVSNARFEDVVSIIEKIKEKFYKTFGFYPELEVEVVK